MSTSTLTDNKYLAAVQSATTPLSHALDDAERQAAERTLLTAGVALKEQCWKKHQWLMRNWDRLEGYKTTLPPDEYDAKELVYLAKIAEYETMFACLAEALALLGQPAPERPEEVVLEQGGLF